MEKKYDYGSDNNESNDDDYDDDDGGNDDYGTTTIMIMTVTPMMTMMITATMIIITTTIRTDRQMHRPTGIDKSVQLQNFATDHHQTQGVSDKSLRTKVFFSYI